jgi:cytochrome c1
MIVRNNDSDPVTIQFGLGDTNSTSTNLASGASREISVSASNGVAYSFQVRAQASGKNPSGTQTRSIKGITANIANPGPGFSAAIAGNTTAGFMGYVGQTTFGTTMTSAMSTLNLTQGSTQFLTDPLLKFRHAGKIKFINQRAIRRQLS